MPGDPPGDWLGVCLQSMSALVAALGAISTYVLLAESRYGLARLGVSFRMVRATASVISRLR
jgi:hypothetical protein